MIPLNKTEKIKKKCNKRGQHMDAKLFICGIMTIRELDKKEKCRDDGSKADPSSSSRRRNHTC